MKLLKNKQYYSELYDKFTIEECRWWEKNAGSDEFESIKDKDPKQVKLKKDWAIQIVTPMALHFIKGERYAKKEETIRQWMERDQASDERVERAVPPSGVRCLGCSSPMDEESRTYLTNDQCQEEVAFMFSCRRCNKGRVYWENGQEWELKPTPCPKCSTDIERTHSRNDNSVSTTETCPDCKYFKPDTVDLKTKEPEIDPNFEADRKKYCLSEKEGQEYLEAKRTLEHFSEVTKDRQENKEVYDALAKLKKLSIAELQDRLRSVTDNIGYKDFELGKPEIQKDVIVEFSVQDTKTDRGEYDGRMDLQKAIKKSLENTNWRLMSDGVSNRLGILTGRLRGVEGEDNLKKLITKSRK